MCNFIKKPKKGANIPTLKKYVPMPPIKPEKEETTSLDKSKQVKREKFMNKQQYQRVIRIDMNGKPFIPNKIVRFKGDKYCGGDDGFDDIFQRLFELETMIENGELDFTPLYYARKFVKFYAENSLSSKEIAKKMYDLLGGKANE